MMLYDRDIKSQEPSPKGTWVLGNSDYSIVFSVSI